MGRQLSPASEALKAAYGIFRSLPSGVPGSGGEAQGRGSPDKFPHRLPKAQTSLAEVRIQADSGQPNDQRVGRKTSRRQSVQGPSVDQQTLSLLGWHLFGTIRTTRTAAAHHLAEDTAAPLLDR